MDKPISSNHLFPIAWCTCGHDDLRQCPFPDNDSILLCQLSTSRLSRKRCKVNTRLHCFILKQRNFLRKVDYHVEFLRCVGLLCRLSWFHFGDIFESASIGFCLLMSVIRLYIKLSWLTTSMKVFKSILLCTCTFCRPTKFKIKKNPPFCRPTKP